MSESTNEWTVHWLKEIAIQIQALNETMKSIQIVIASTDKREED